MPLEVIEVARIDAFGRNLIHASVSSSRRWFLAQTCEAEKLGGKGDNGEPKSIGFSRCPTYRLTFRELAACASYMDVLWQMVNLDGHWA